MAIRLRPPSLASPPPNHGKGRGAAVHFATFTTCDQAVAPGCVDQPGRLECPLAVLTLTADMPPSVDFVRFASGITPHERDPGLLRHSDEYGFEAGTVRVEAGRATLERLGARLSAGPENGVAVVGEEAGRLDSVQRSDLLEDPTGGWRDRNRERAGGRIPRADQGDTMASPGQQGRGGAPRWSAAENDDVDRVQFGGAQAQPVPQP